jgi:hypothetical protein
MFISHISSFHQLSVFTDVFKERYFIADRDPSMEPQLSEEHGVRIAVEGCVCSDHSSTILWCSWLTINQCHGTLHAIYASIERACAIKGWPGVDLLIIGGDFQVPNLPYTSTNQQQILTSQNKNSQYAMHMIYNAFPCQQNTAKCTISTNTILELAKHLT